MVLFIFSFNKIADNTSTIIGTVIIITDPFIGVVYCKPLKNVSIFKATPKNAALINLEKSFNSIFFDEPNSETIQNNAPAKVTLRTINPNGIMCPPSITSFAKVNVTP